MSDQSTPVTRLPLRKGASLRWLPFLFIFLQSVLYGLGDPISKSAYEVLPVYSLLTARYGIALAFLLLVFGRRIWRGLKVCSPRDWLLPSLCMGGAYVANNIALELTAATSVAFLRSLTTLQTAASALMALLCALAFDQGIHLGAATPSVWMSILYLALFCTVAGYLLQNAALGVLSSRTVALLQCFCPVMTAMFSRLLLGEQLSTPGILGAVIILLCVAAETMMKDDKPLS